MAKRKKIHAKRGLSHEELRKDKFLESSAKLVKYVSKRKERFIFGVIAVIALVSIANRYFAGRGRSDAQAEFQMTMAHQLLLNRDYENALSRYQSIVDQYGGSRQGREAHYWIGETNFNRGEYEEAVRAYEQFLSVSSGDRVLSASALGNLGACYESLGDHVSAAKTYRRVYEKFPKSPIAGVAALKSGIYYEQTGELEQAEEMYSVVADEYPESDLAQEAKRNLTLLKGRMEAGRPVDE